MVSLSGASFRSSRSSKSGSSKGSKQGKVHAGEENAYASVSDHSDDLTALSESIKQHASVLRGDDELVDDFFDEDDDFGGDAVKRLRPTGSPGLTTGMSTIQSESQTGYNRPVGSPGTIQSDLYTGLEPSIIRSSSQDHSNSYYYQYGDDTSMGDAPTFAMESSHHASKLPPPPPREQMASTIYSSMSTIQTNLTSLRSIPNVDGWAEQGDITGDAPSTADESSIRSSPFQSMAASPTVPQPTIRPSLYNSKPPLAPAGTRTFAVPLNSSRVLESPAPGGVSGKYPVKPALRASRKYSSSVAPTIMESDSVSGGSYHSRGSHMPSVASQSRVTFAETVHTQGAYTTNQPTRRTTKLRVAIAFMCLVISLGVTLLYGHGDFGLWMTNQFIGSTAAKEGEYTGLPGAVGSPPAYNGTFEIPDLESMNIVLPTASMEQNLAEWRIPYPAATRVDTPLFWAIPKAGGNVVMRILVKCLGLVEASDEGKGHTEATLQILETVQGTRYVNVDPTTVQGLERAKLLSLADSGMAEVMSTSLIPQAATIFSPGYKGRLFVVFRSPMERAMSIYIQAKTRNPSIASMSIVDYAANYLPNNEMVRTLAYKTPSEDLSEEDLYIAMEVLRRKAVVGLVDRIEESIQRFHAYFGWQSIVIDSVLECQEELLAPSTDRLAAPAKGSEAHNFLFAQNRLDIRLFEYAQYLFDVQGGNTRDSK